MGRRIAFLLAAFAALVAAFPNWYGQWKADSWVFLWSGFPWDSNQYLAFMRVGYRGDWLFTNLLTSETDPPVLLMPFYVFLGHVAAWYGALLAWLTGAAVPAQRAILFVYQNSRVLLSLVLLVLVYWLASQLTRRRSRRLWILAFAAFAGGMGIQEVISVESNVLASCILFPNFIASLICYVLSAGAFLQALKADVAATTTAPIPRPAPPFLISISLAALGGMGLGFIHPFDIPPLAALAASVFAWQWARSRRFPSRLFLVSLVFALFAGGPILYQTWLTWRYADYHAIHAGNAMPMTTWYGPFALLDAYLGLGLVGVLFALRRRDRPEALFLICWIVSGLLIMFVPFSFQRRMIEGYPLALACALPWAAEGLIVRPLLRRRGAAKSARARIRSFRHIAYAFILVILLPKTLTVLYDRSVGTFGSQSDLYYVPYTEVAAYEWIERQPDWRETVLATGYFGNRIPLFTGHRVFYGHNIMTVNSQQKSARTELLFAREMPVDEFRRIVRDYGIRYIYWTEADRHLDALKRDFDTYDPETLGKPVFANEYGRVFRVCAP